MAVMFAYIAGSPFVFIDLYGVSPSHYGWLFGANALGYAFKLLMEILTGKRTLCDDAGHPPEQ